MGLDFRSLFLSADGRINRAKWWAGALVLLVVWVIADAVFGGSILGGILLLLLLAGIAYPAYAVCAKRFQDRNRPGITALYGVGPLLIAALLVSFGVTGTPSGPNAIGWICTLIFWGVGLWFTIELGLLKGTPGPNAFGGNPLVAAR